jgi:hypothetical protein
MNDLDTRRAELARLHEVALSQGEQPSELADGTVLQVREQPTELADGTVLQVEAPPPPTLTRKQLDKALEADVAADHELGREFRRAKSMRDAGFVFLMMGVGLVPIAAMLTGAAFDPKDGAIPWVGPLATAPVIVAVPLIVGGTLYGIGKKQTKQIKARYEARPSSLAWMPVPIPISLSKGGGLGFVGRF